MSYCLYRCFDDHGKLLYIGITGNFAQRTFNHEQNSKWFRKARNLTLHHFQSREATLDAEREAIKNERPIYNIMHNGRFVYYVRTRKVTNDPIGDFVSDFNRDPLPEPQDLDHLLTILALRGACNGAREAAEEIWKEYQITLS